MTAWGRLPVEERMRIRKVQAFNVVDLTIRLGGLCLWLPGACLLVALAVVLLYDLLFIALPWWLTIPVITIMIIAVLRRTATRTERAKYSRGTRPWTRRSDR